MSDALTLGDLDRCRRQVMSTQEAAAFVAAVEALMTRTVQAEGRVVAAEQALREIKTIQPRCLETLESHGVVFDGPLGNDPTNFQHVAFSIYTDLCDADNIARCALEDIDAASPGSVAAHTETTDA